MNRIWSGVAMAPIWLRTWLISSFSAAFRASPVFTSPLGVTKQQMPSPFEVVREADDGGFGDAVVRDQGRFDFHRREPVAGDVEHVVDAAHHPVVAVLVSAGTVAGEVVFAVELAEVRFDEPVVVAVQRAEHVRPGLRHHEQAPLIGAERFALLVDDVGHDARQRLGAASRAWWPSRRAAGRS